MFHIERISGSKDALRDAVHSALKEIEEREHKRNSQFLNSIATAVGQIITTFPSKDSNLVVTVQGMVQSEGFSSVSIAVREFPDDVMVGPLSPSGVI